jgi:hypothetical protein
MTCISASCESISASCARACATRIFAAATFFSCAAGALRVGGRNDPAVEQILLTPRIIVQEYQLRVLRVGIVDSRVDLRRRKIAACTQLRRIELHDHLAFVQTIPFPRQDFFHASS